MTHLLSFLLFIHFFHTEYPLLIEISLLRSYVLFFFYYYYLFLFTGVYKKSLKYLLEQRITTPVQTRWLPKLLGYDYQIEYKRGLENQGADSLSRVVEFQFLSLSLLSADWWSLLQKEIQQDSFYGDLLKKGSAPLLQRDGVWFKNDKVFLNPTSQFIPKILNYGHSSPVSGHYSYHKTLARIKQNFLWSGMVGWLRSS